MTQDAVLAITPPPKPYWRYPRRLRAARLRVVAASVELKHALEELDELVDKMPVTSLRDALDGAVGAEVGRLEIEDDLRDE